MIIRSLRANSRFDRLIGMVEIGDDKFETPDKLKEQRRRKHLGVVSRRRTKWLSGFTLSQVQREPKTIQDVWKVKRYKIPEQVQTINQLANFATLIGEIWLILVLKTGHRHPIIVAARTKKQTIPRLDPARDMTPVKLTAICKMQFMMMKQSLVQGDCTPRDGETTRDFNPDLMATCMNSEIITGERRKALDADLEDVQEMKRRRYSEGRPQKMVLRQTTERRYFLWRKGYLVNAAIQENGQIITMERKWRANETKVPRSFTEAMKTPQKTNGMLVWKKR
ncbi:unnamed protein product [Peronospora belbahrii]|uniref:PiggyBac transposable element-derived protein domain-containing protein n=1 Tax=Peronospora belbahrii TaxID=622444 RepID=A0ABN8D460_9STRA|nr:unnamed protein product [Peronospora belbahrii]